MRTQRWLTLVSLLAMLVLAAGCRQQDPDARPTPPVVPDATLSAGEDAYPPPLPNPDSDAAYPPPATNPGGDTTYPAPPTDSPTDTPDQPADPNQPTTPPIVDVPPDQPAPVVPIITESDVTVEPLPEAGVFGPPEGSSGSGYEYGSTVQHTVIRGEWLLQVARCYGTTYEAVRDANRLPAPDYIVPGTTLTVPGVGSFGPVIGPPCVVETTVQSGDTWEALAQTYETTPAILQRVNPGPLSVGRVIFVPAIVPPTTGSLPQLSHHLVFNLGGDLAIWRSTDGLVELTVDAPRIKELATNNRGRYVMVRQTRDDGASDEIALIDTVARTSVVVETGLRAVPENPLGDPTQSLHVSPDGMWAVYVEAEDTTYRVTSLQTMAPGTRYSVSDIAIPDNGRPVGVSLHDGVGGTSFIVTEPSGMIEYPYSLDRAPRTIVAIDQASAEPVVAFLDVIPIPGGPHVLAPGAFLEGGVYLLVDVETGAFSQIPGSESYVTTGATFALDDGTIVVVSPTAQGALGPLWTFYRPQAAGSTLTLNPVTSYVTPISTANAPSGSLPGYSITAPTIQSVSPPHRITIIGDDQAEGGLWQANGGPADLFRLNAVPEEPAVNTWVPDGSGLLASTFDTTGIGSDWYIAADGSELFSLSDWLGGRVSDGHWVQE